MKRLENIESKNEQQLQTIKDQKEQLKMIEHDTNSAKKKSIFKFIAKGSKDTEKEAEEDAEEN